MGAHVCVCTCAEHAIAKQLSVRTKFTYISGVLQSACIVQGELFVQTYVPKFH